MTSKFQWKGLWVFNVEFQLDYTPVGGAGILILTLGVNDFATRQHPKNDR